MKEPTEKAKLLLSDLYLDYIQSDISKNMSDEEIRKEVTNIYTKVNTSFENAITKMSPDKLHFSLNDYLDGIMGRITRSMNVARKYDSTAVNRIMEMPYSYKDELLRMSMYFYMRVQEYKGIIDYKSGILTYANILRPRNVDENFNVDNYLKNLQFVKDYNIESKFADATKRLVRDDVFYGYEITDGSGINFMWKKLPPEFCIILGRDKFETYRVGFDVRYFEKFPDDVETFPQEFKVKYQEYLAKKSAKMKTKKGKLMQVEAGLETIIELDNEKAFAFKFDESVDFVLPYYSAMFLDMVRLLELKDVEVLSEVSDNYKLIHQLVPINKESGKEDDFMISGEYMLEFHNNLRKNVPKDVGVATTPMEVTAVTLKPNIASAGDTITAKYVSNLLTQSGTSSQLFNGTATSAVGLLKNIEVDENMMFRILRQYELFMNKRLFLYNKGAHKYTLQFLDHTRFNTEVLHNRYLKAGQFGMNTEFEVAATMGIKQIDFINNANLMDKLDIRGKLIPFQSSHTNSGDGEEVGGKKAQGNLTDDGLESRGRDL